MRKLTVLLIIAILILIPSVLFIINFKNQIISDDITDWSAFGTYFAGTVGTLITILAILIVYVTFLNQKEQQFENRYNQLLNSYSTHLNLIHEKWLMFPTPVEYLTGREIFGCAANYFYHENPVKNNYEERFNKMHQTHINVFGSYINFLLEVIDTIKKRSNLDKTTSDYYLQRFSFTMSFYELVYFGYYSLYHLKSKEKELFNTILRNFLFRINIDYSTELQHREVALYLKEKLFSPQKKINT
ncbi:MAG TPA: hypothetical protein VI583_03930 [Cyclobacteriaceae bacterium]|nr:hypothetical protein [Cyclobacteriaceae bacterium]